MFGDLVAGALYALRIAGAYLVLGERFVRLYWQYAVAVAAGAFVAWMSADAASDYTRGGWEMHFEQRAWGLDLHVHHWYYGVPLVVLAFVLLDRRPVASVFVFVLGQALAAHSFYNEGGIPSIFEGGAVVRVRPFVYWPVASLLVALFTFFVVRAHEWLSFAAEREAAAMSYLATRDATGAIFDAIDVWGRDEFDRRVVRAAGSGVRVASYSRLDRSSRGLWELHCSSSPYDDGRVLVTVRVEHVPFRAGSASLLEFLRRADEIARRHAEPILGR